MSWIIDKINELKYKRLAHQSWSQYGEDLYIDSLLKHKTYGFYIDVGCFHPFRYSNTYRFYKRGWNGLNIDANKENIKLFKQYRKRDINIHAAVSNKAELMEYIKYEGASLNQILPFGSQTILNEKIIDRLQIETQPLATLLNNHLSKGQEIDFLSIDVEGCDYEVILSNDWESFKPLVICVEANDIIDLIQISNNQIYRFLNTIGYSLVGKTFNSLFFVKMEC